MSVVGVTLKMVGRFFNMSVPWVTFIAEFQASIQAFLRPAAWFPFIKKFHSHKEIWDMPSDSNKSNMQDILRGLMTVIQNDNSRSYWKVNKAETTFIQVFVFTRFEWLDVIEFNLKGRTVEVWSFSSGLLPLFIPFAPIINLFFSWIPFFDFGLNRRRISRVVDAIDTGIQRLF